MLIQIPGTTLYRDTQSMGLVNKDRNGLEEYIKKRNMASAQKDEINNVKMELATVKTDMQEIKQLLLQLLDKNIHS